MKDIRKLNPESFTKEMKKELQECENRLHNYQRSQEMNNTLNEAGIEDSIENNQMIVENLLDAAKEVTDGSIKKASECGWKRASGFRFKLQEKRWKVLYCDRPLAEVHRADDHRGFVRAACRLL